MKRALVLLFVPATIGCTEARGPEAGGGWWDSGDALGVEEHIGFSDDPYAFPAEGEPGLLDLRHAVLGCYGNESAGDCEGDPASADAPRIQIAWGGDEIPTEVGGCAIEETDVLPVEQEVMITLRPLFYIKARDCKLDADPGSTDAATDKFYASFFVEDATGGMLVLADTRVAHFDTGDQVRMRIRSIGRQYDMDAVYAYDVERVDRDARDVHYEALDATTSLGPDHRGRVIRAEGTVVSLPDDFGSFTIESAEGTRVNVQYVTELNRRGYDLPVGTVIRATGPVIYSYSSHSIIVAQVGQIEVLEAVAD